MVIKKGNSKNITIKLGGSVLYNDNLTVRLDLLGEYKLVLLDLIKKGYKINLVVGGGKITRKYVKHLKDHLNHPELDEVSILLTQLNAFIVKGVLKSLNSRIVKTYQEVLNDSSSNMIISGGLYPGQSTNGTAALIAEITESEYLINLFGFDKLQTSDPLDKNTERKIETLDKISYSNLEQLASSFQQVPGHYELFDQLAMTIVKRSKIPLVFLNGNRPKFISEFLQGMPVGTKVGNFL